MCANSAALPCLLFLSSLFPQPFLLPLPFPPLVSLRFRPMADQVNHETPAGFFLTEEEEAALATALSTTDTSSAGSRLRLRLVIRLGAAWRLLPGSPIFVSKSINGPATDLFLLFPFRLSWFVRVRQMASSLMDCRSCLPTSGTASFLSLTRWSTAPTVNHAWFWQPLRALRLMRCPSPARGATLFRIRPPNVVPSLSLRISARSHVAFLAVTVSVAVL